VEIREASAGDAERIVSLLDQLGYSATREAVSARLTRLGEDPASSILVAEEHGRLLGLAASHAIAHLERDGATCRLTALVVDEGSRRQGLGRALVLKVVADAEQRGCERVEVTLRPQREAAKGLYLGIGFEERPLRLIRRLGPG
jgi:ribosomal protein S18 acetylase RimI-like enzyme